MSSTVCQFCGNLATATSPLIRDAHGRLYHAWPEDLGELDGPCPCPQPAPGFGICSKCETIQLHFVCARCQSPWNSDSRRSTKAVDVRPDPSHARAAVVPSDGPGLTQRDLGSVWELGERSTRDLVTRLVETGALAVEEQLTAHGGKPTKRYRRVAP